MGPTAQSTRMANVALVVKLVTPTMTASVRSEPVTPQEAQSFADVGAHGGAPVPLDPEQTTHKQQCRDRDGPQSYRRREGDSSSCCHQEAGQGRADELVGSQLGRVQAPVGA